ncbi:hypothetical protein ASL14_07295 [Paenibacillus sp. IHB B 3084]|nr:hypothetical protein ASL14_07295 [Paenibacillus sp. IHB B 3084]
MEVKTQTKPVKYYNLDAINRYEILDGNGRISQSAAKEKAIGEYKEFNKHRRIVSDFDRVIKTIQGEQK